MPKQTRKRAAKVVALPKVRARRSKAKPAPAQAIAPSSVDNVSKVPTRDASQGVGRNEYLTQHLAYLESEIGKYPDKPDVVGRLQQRIRETKAELKAGR